MKTKNSLHIALAASITLVVLATVVPAQAALDCAKVATVIPNQFPSWSDGSGWNLEKFYSTIQMADIDGDGKAELLGRESGGIVASHFDAALGIWRQEDSPGPFSDATGWGSPQYYRTVQFADIDGDGQAELIGRSGQGIEQFHWNKATKSWQQLGSCSNGNCGPWTDHDGWAQPQYYATIQLADIDGDGQAELIGRGGEGIEQFHWDKGTASWQRLGACTSGRCGPLSDADGSAQPQYYATIQLADIDGDGQAELLGRMSDGVHVYRYDKGANTWALLATLAGFSDAAGWNQPQHYSTIQVAHVDGSTLILGRGAVGGEPVGLPFCVFDPSAKSFGCLGFPILTEAFWAQPQYYSTIQAADIDGDGSDEILARGPDGLQAWDVKDLFNEHLLATAAAFSDGRGFGLPQNYLTIQAAHVAGQPGALIIGKSSDGIETWRYDNGAFASTVVHGFPPFTGAQFTAYAAISKAVFPAAPNPDLRIQYKNGAFKSEWASGTKKITVQALRDKPEPGVPVDDWNTVVDTLVTELQYVADAYNWFDNLDDLLQRITNDEDAGGGAINRVNTYLNIPVSDSRNAALNILSLVGKIVQGIAGLAGNFVPEAKLVGTVSGMVSTAFSAGVSASGSPPNIQAALANLQQAIVDKRIIAQEGAACMRDAFLEDDGLLTALAQPVEALQVTWDATDNPRLAQAAATGYELEMWQALTPLVWNVDSPDGQRNCPQPPFPYPTDLQGHTYIWGIPGSRNDAWLQTGHCFGLDQRSSAPPELALRHLFSPPNPDGTGALGIPLADVHCGFEGWHVPNSLGAGVCNNGSNLAAAAAVETERTKRLRLARTELEQLQAEVSRDVKDKAMRNELKETLDEDKRLLTQARTVKGTSFMTLAELTLDDFVLQMETLSGRKFAAKGTQRLIARAHAIQSLVSEVPAFVTRGEVLQNHR